MRKPLHKTRPGLVEVSLIVFRSDYLLDERRALPLVGMGLGVVLGLGGVGLMVRVGVQKGSSWGSKGLGLGLTVYAERTLLEQLEQQDEIAHGNLVIDFSLATRQGSAS
jgi:hypothetical protein